MPKDLLDQPEPTDSESELIEASQFDDEVFAWAAAWRDKPRQFVQEVLRTEPYPWQAEALDQLGEHDRFAVRSGRGVGKSTFLSWAVLWWLTTRRPAKIGVTAPKIEQLSETLWPELSYWHQRMPDDLREQFTWTRTRFTANDEQNRFAIARTARPENPEAFQGLHSLNFMFVVDEASGVAEPVFNTGVGMLTTPGAKMVMAANPTRRTGFFYRVFHNEKLMEKWVRRHVSCVQPDGQPVHGVTQEWIDERAAQWGRESNQFRAQVLGEFPFDDEDTVIPVEFVKSAIGREITVPAGERPVWGVDVARHGGDSCALAKRHGPRLLEKVKTWYSDDLMKTAGLIKLEYDQTDDALKPAWIMVDAIGLGYGVVDRLKEFNLPVRGINVGESPSVKDTYVHLRDELWYKGREWFGSRLVSMPDDEMLFEELVSIKSEPTPAGKIIVESKDKMRTRLDRSPDRADAFLLTLMREGNRARREQKLAYSRKFR